MRGAASARPLRPLFTAAAAARPCVGGLALPPRRAARPTTLRPLHSTATEAEQHADPSPAAAGGAEGVAGLAAEGGVEAALTWPARSHGCGSLTAADLGGSPVTVCGWVDRYRNLGGLLFLDVRDHTGIIQVVVDPQQQPEVAAKAERLRAEYVVAVTGQLRARQDPNPRMKTGDLEISPTDVKVGGLGRQRGCARDRGAAPGGTSSCWGVNVRASDAAAGASRAGASSPPPPLPPAHRC